MGFHALLGRFPRNLSAGQKQRVALGRCIIRNPRVFLEDMEFAFDIEKVKLFDPESELAIVN